jgi:hypothetical protein
MHNSCYLRRLVYKITVVLIQQIANQLAKQCVVALAALYGPHEAVAAGDARIRAALHTLLTPYLCRRLADPDQHEVPDHSTKYQLK